MDTEGFDFACVGSACSRSLFLHLLLRFADCSTTYDHVSIADCMECDGSECLNGTCAVGYHSFKGGNCTGKASVAADPRASFVEYAYVLCITRLARQNCPECSHYLIGDY